jgi:hypothetical protein
MAEVPHSRVRGAAPKAPREAALRRRALGWPRTASGALFRAFGRAGALHSLCIHGAARATLRF